VQDLIVALGLVLVIEGLLYALFPDALRRMLYSLLETPAQTLRFGGAAVALVGLLIVWLVRSG